jgi:hypothetical protein
MQAVDDAAFWVEARANISEFAFGVKSLVLRDSPCVAVAGCNADGHMNCSHSHDVSIARQEPRMQGSVDDTASSASCSDTAAVPHEGGGSSKLAVYDVETLEGVSCQVVFDGCKGYKVVSLPALSQAQQQQQEQEQDACDTVEWFESLQALLSRIR